MVSPHAKEFSVAIEEVRIARHGAAGWVICRPQNGTRAFAIDRGVGGRRRRDAQHPAITLPLTRKGKQYISYRAAAYEDGIGLVVAQNGTSVIAEKGTEHPS